MNTKQLKRFYPRAMAYADEHGFVLDRRKGHFYFQAPSGQKVFIGNTPSDHRADKNAVSHLRRCAIGNL